MFSRLTIGTAQFGQDYGVANTSGPPPLEQIVEILRAALELGVTTVDTAAAYGSSEELLGRALKELDAADRLKVITKIRKLFEEERSQPEARARAVRESVESSRQKLGLDCLPLVLFHAEEDAVGLDALLKEVDRGRVGAAGVSCGNLPDRALQFLDDARVSALQIPCNLLDPRFPRADVLRLAARKEVTVFVRSVYLQGLLLMPEASVPEFLGSILPVRRELEAIANRAGISMAALALRYVLSLEGVTSLLTGVETREQLVDNVELLQQGPLDEAIVRAIEELVPDLPPHLITPYLWNQA